MADCITVTSSTRFDAVDEAKIISFKNVLNTKGQSANI